LTYAAVTLPLGAVSTVCCQACCWGMATIRDKLGHCLDGFFTSPTRVTSPSPSKRDRAAPRNEVPWSRESAQDPHFHRVLPHSALTLGSAGKRAEFGLPPDCQRRRAARRRSGMGIGFFPSPHGEAESLLANLGRDRHWGTNGPFCRESLPYPLLDRYGEVDEGSDVGLASWFVGNSRQIVDGQPISPSFANEHSYRNP
jgi:hypothetical protein